MALAINTEDGFGAMAAMGLQWRWWGEPSILSTAILSPEAAPIIAAMLGLHLTADLHGCPADRAPMTDAAALRVHCLAAVRGAGLTPVGELFHSFAQAAGSAADAPQGVTGVVLLAESHLAVHTWPERGGVTLDVYVCNRGRDNSAHARALLEALLPGFAPTHVERHALQRGAVDAAAA